MLRKSWSILLCLVFVVSLLAACSSGSKPEQGTSSSSTSPQSTPQPKETKPPELVKLKLYSPGVTARGSDDALLTSEIQKKVVQDIGINLDMTFESSAYDQVINKVNLLMASGDLDAFNVPWGYQADWVTKPDLLLPLDDLLNQYGTHLKALFPENVWNVTKINGKIMGIPVPSPVGSWVVPWIRKDLLDKAGLPVPKTIDEFENVLRAFKKLDSSLIPLATDDPGWLYSDFGGVALPVKQTDDSGNLLPNVGNFYYQTLDFKNYMETLQRWYKDGLLNKELYTWNHTKNYEAMTKGKVGAVVSGAWLQNEFDVLNGVDPKNPPKDPNIKQQWVIVDQLVSKTGQPTVMGGAPDRFVGVLKSSKHAKEVIQFLDWMATDVKNMILTDSGIEGKHYKIVDGKRDKINAAGDVPLISNIVSNFFNAPFVSERIQTSVGPVGTEYLKAYDKKSFKVSTNIDASIMYSMKNTKDKLNDLDKMFKEYYQKIILGDLPVSAIDEMSGKLDKIGIKDVIAERNQEYQKSTGK